MFSGLFRDYPNIRFPREKASNLLQWKGDDIVSWLPVFLELSEGGGYRRPLCSVWRVSRYSPIQVMHSCLQLRLASPHPASPGCKPLVFANIEEETQKSNFSYTYFQPVYLLAVQICPRFRTYLVSFNSWTFLGFYGASWPVSGFPPLPSSVYLFSAPLHLLASFQHFIAVVSFQFYSFSALTWCLFKIHLLSF